jgi:predicted O-linked N-acetylglucosamine transferase (SPINDLY family)
VVSIEQEIQAAHRHFANGQLAATDVLCAKILTRSPNHPIVLHLRGLALYGLGNIAAAITALRGAIAIKPSYRLHSDLGTIYEKQGSLDEAIAHFRQAIALEAGNTQLYCSLGTVLYRRGEDDAAIDACKAALQLEPANAKAHNLLGALMSRKEDWAAAASSFRVALGIMPHNAHTYNNLGMALSAQGHTEDAIENFRQAITLQPDLIAARSNLLFCLTQSEIATPQYVFEEHCRYGTRLAALRHPRPVHDNARDPGRRLRLGFVSADLWNHPVANLIEAIWGALDRTRVEIWVYHNFALEDEVSARLKKVTQSWRPVFHATDDDLYRQIRADRIDVLFDLSGHTAGNRLPVFARKPAPLQASWIGYPATTGMAEMDYYLADRHLAPAGMMDHLFTEKIVRLPAVCRFLPYPDSPPVTSLPALHGRRFTFGSFNRPGKLSETVIALWCRILRAVPTSAMLLGSINDERLRVGLIERFARHGVTEERLILHPRTHVQAYLTLHHQVDLILDTFPYSGATTSAHAIWMGVPVLTLVGNAMSSRQTAAILYPTGLDRFVTHTEEEFVAQAVYWTEHLDELNGLRGVLRERINRSPLMDVTPIARAMENAMRIIWQRWCKGLPAESFEALP